MSDEEKSCNNCDHFRVCKFKPCPFMGTSSDGIMFIISYEHFAKKLYQLYGQFCDSYRSIL